MVHISALFGLTVFAALVAAAAEPEVAFAETPSEEDAASVARTLVHRESLTNINTIKKIRSSDGTVRDLPFSTVEYYADCDNDGNPYWLVVDIGTTYQNIRKGSDFSFTIRTGDHPSYEEVNTTYPGGIEKSPAGSPRINLSGKFDWIPFKSPFELLKLHTCFLERHPDAVAWLPGNRYGPHTSRWVKLVVEDVFLIGGFGDRAYIGNIDADAYHAASVLDSGSLPI